MSTTVIINTKPARPRRSCVITTRSLWLKLLANWWPQHAGHCCSPGWHHKTLHCCRCHQKVISILVWQLLKQSKCHFWTFISGTLIFQSTSSPSSRDMQSCWKCKPAYSSQKEWKGSDRGKSILLSSCTLNSSQDQTGKCCFITSGFIQHEWVLVGMLLREGVS